jgi:membrane protein YdbS with pleckstrin-like domain
VTDHAGDPRYETTVPLVSRALALFVALSSVPVLLVVAGLTYTQSDPWWVVALAAVLLFGPIPLLRRLRFEVELAADELRYRVRPWHRRDRVVPLAEVTAVEPRRGRPASRTTLRRVNLGRGWVDWSDDEVRYVLRGESGVRIERESGRSLELWLPGAEELTRELAGAGRGRRA